MNLQYVVATGSSWASSNSKSILYNYTWIFSKQSRSYTNAYKTIPYTSSDTVVHFDPMNEYLMVTNRTKITNYDLNKAVLILNQFDDKATGTSQNLTLSIVSSDSLDPKTDVCDVNVTVHFVYRANITLWPTNIATTEIFYSNYPGELSIPLRRYAFGPNITYDYMKPFS